MINPEHFEIISERIKKSGLKNQLLIDDLTDHFCCLVEMNMEKGSDFDNAYKLAYEQTSPNGLEEIQNETLFLLNYKKIIIMKKIIYSVGFLFTLGLFIGIYLKIMHLPFANVLLFGGSTGLGFIFLPLLMLNHFKAKAVGLLSEKLKWLFGVISFMIFIASSWFKIFHLQGATILLGLSFLIFCLGFLPFFFFRMYKKSVETI